MRPRWAGRRRAASARPRPRTPPASPPRPGRSRRTGRRASRGRGPTRRGRPGRAARIGSRSSSGRTSTAPPMRAAGKRAAIAVATSRSSASNTKMPPRYSLASTNGPSLRSASPFSTRTVVADSVQLQLLATDDTRRLKELLVLLDQRRELAPPAAHGRPACRRSTARTSWFLLGSRVRLYDERAAAEGTTTRSSGDHLPGAIKLTNWSGKPEGKEGRDQRPGADGAPSTSQHRAVAGGRKPL